MVQCFTHNPMATARFKRSRLIVYMDEYESGVPGGQYREFDSVSYEIVVSWSGAERGATSTNGGDCLERSGAERSEERHRPTEAIV